MPRAPLVVKNGSKMFWRIFSVMPTPVSVTCAITRLAVAPARQLEAAALRHGVDRVQDQVGEDLAQLGGVAQDRRRLGRVEHRVDVHLAEQRVVLPARPA